MSAAHVHNLDLSPPPIVKTIGQRSLFVGLIFGIASVAGAFINSKEFFQAYLLAFMLWLGITLGSMAILMIRHLTGGGWGTVIRRTMGAAMRCIPLMTLFFVPILFGLPKLYVWATPVDSITDKKLHEHVAHLAHYLNPQAILVRACIYFFIWNLLSFLLSKWSAEQNQPPLRPAASKFKVLSGPGLVVYAFSISFAIIDWVMSIDPTWISTIYCLIILIGEVLSAMCFAVVIERILFRYKPMSELLKPNFVQDHGKWMLTFIMVWAYFSFSQWLIIWAGNLPEEITWYVRRLNGGWGPVGLFLAVFQFAVPFVFLLSRPFKRDVTKLVWLAVWVIFMRFVDLFWIIEPNFSNTFTLTWLEIVIPIAMGGLWLAYFCRNLASLPLLPIYDEDVKEVLEPAHE